MSILVNPGAALADGFRESGLDTAGVPGVFTLMFQQPPLAFQTSAVTGQRSVGSDDSMTRHDDPNRIGTICETNSSHSFRASDLLGKLSVRNGGTPGNIPQFLPDTALKGRAGRFDGYIVDRSNVTREVAVDRIPQAVRIMSGFKLESSFPVVHPQEAQHAFFVISPIEGT